MDNDRTKEVGGVNNTGPKSTLGASGRFGTQGKITRESLRNFFPGNQRRTNTDTGSSGRTEESAPEFTRPDTLEMFGYEEDSKKNKKIPKTGPAITTDACGNISAGIFEAISYITTKSPMLGLNNQEKDEIGRSLYDALNNFSPTSPITKVVTFFAPWSTLFYFLSKAIWKRLTILSQNKQTNKYLDEQMERAKQVNMFEQDRGVAYAPDPGLVNAK